MSFERTEFGERVDGINQALWWIGWHGKGTIGGVTVLGAGIGYLVDSTVFLGVLGFFASPLVWIIGVYHINTNYKTVLEVFHSEVSEAGQEVLRLDGEEDNVEVYSLFGGTGSKPLRRPNLSYSSATMYVADVSLTVHDGNELDMVRLKPEINDSTNEIFYDQVAGVYYDDGKFWVNKSDGYSQSWESEREPDDALDDIQNRVREYKRRAVA